MSIKDLSCFKCRNLLSCDINDEGNLNLDSWVKISYSLNGNKTICYLCEECKNHYYNDMQQSHDRWFYYTELLNHDEDSYEEGSNDHKGNVESL